MFEQRGLRQLTGDERRGDGRPSSACPALLWLPNDGPAPKSFSEAPDFILPGRYGVVRLSSYAGRRHVILYFMSNLTSSRVWQGAIALERLRGRLAALDATALIVLGGDLWPPAERLARDLGFSYPVLNDKELRVHRCYGLPGEPSSASATVLVGADGRIRHVHRGLLPGRLFDAASLINSLVRTAEESRLGEPYPAVAAHRPPVARLRC